MRRKIKWCFKRKLLGDVVFGGWLCQSYCSEAELRLAEGLGCAGPDPQVFAVSMRLQTVKLFQTPLPVISSMLKRLGICRQQSDSWTARRNITWVRLRAGALLAANWIHVLIEDAVLPPCAQVWEQQPVLWALAVCHIASQWQRNAFCSCLYSSIDWSTVPLYSWLRCGVWQQDTGARTMIPPLE